MYLAKVQFYPELAKEQIETEQTKEDFDTAKEQVSQGTDCFEGAYDRILTIQRQSKILKIRITITGTDGLGGIQGNR